MKVVVQLRKPEWSSL